MQQLPKQQLVLLSATVFTLVLGMVFTRFQPTHESWIWPAAVALGLVWGTIGAWVVWRNSRNSAATKKQ